MCLLTKVVNYMGNRVSLRFLPPTVGCWADEWPPWAVDYGRTPRWHHCQQTYQAGRGLTLRGRQQQREILVTRSLKTHSPGWLAYHQKLGHPTTFSHGNSIWFLSYNAVRRAHHPPQRAQSPAGVTSCTAQSPGAGAGVPESVPPTGHPEPGTGNYYRTDTLVNVITDIYKSTLVAFQADYIADFALHQPMITCHVINYCLASECYIIWCA